MGWMDSEWSVSVMDEDKLKHENQRQFLGKVRGIT